MTKTSAPLLYAELPTPTLAVNKAQPCLRKARAFHAATAWLAFGDSNAPSNKRRRLPSAPDGRRTRLVQKVGVIVEIQSHTMRRIHPAAGASNYEQRCDAC